MTFAWEPPSEPCGSAAVCASRTWRHARTCRSHSSRSSNEAISTRSRSRRCDGSGACWTSASTSRHVGVAGPSIACWRSTTRCSPRRSSACSRAVTVGSSSIYGERGVIDLLAFHPATGSLLVVELKTAIVDVNELVGTLDRKTRLASRVAADRGWRSRSVSRWLIVARGSTNHRRIDAHRAVLRAAFPDDGRAVRSWLHAPIGTVSALSTWSLSTRGGAGRRSLQRVRA
jgi:hypothetical protein